MTSQPAFSPIFFFFCFIHYSSFELKSKYIYLSNKPDHSTHNTGCTRNSNCGWSCSLKSWTGPWVPRAQPAHLLRLSPRQLRGLLRELCSDAIWQIGSSPPFPVQAAIAHWQNNIIVLNAGTFTLLHHEGKSFPKSYSIFMIICFLKRLLLFPSFWVSQASLYTFNEITA